MKNLGVFGGPLESYAVADAHDGVIKGKGDGRTREDMQSRGPNYLRKVGRLSKGYMREGLP